MSVVNDPLAFEEWQFEHLDDQGRSVYSSLWIPSDAERQQVAEGFNLKLSIRLPDEFTDPESTTSPELVNGNGHIPMSIQEASRHAGLSYDIDDNGAPILLARAPGQVADQGPGSGAIVYRGAKSGNKNFDPITGRFSGKTLKKVQVIAQTMQQGALPVRAGLPQGVDPTVWERRMDAVRDAARLMKTMDINEIRGFLKDRVVDVNAVDLNAFMADVRAQQLADLADVLDQSVKARSKGVAVKVIAPDRWTKQVFRGLTAPEALQVVKRLEGRNWDPEDIEKYVISRITNRDVRNALEQAYGQQEPKSGKKLPAKEGGTGA